MIIFSFVLQFLYSLRLLSHSFTIDCLRRLNSSRRHVFVPFGGELVARRPANYGTIQHVPERRCQPFGDLFEHQFQLFDCLECDCRLRSDPVPNGWKC